MTTYLLVQGMDPVELNESFNFARKRCNDAAKAKIDYEQGNIDGYQPFHDLSFKTVNDDGSKGRLTVATEKVIGVGSDEAKDEGSGE